MNSNKSELERLGVTIIMQAVWPAVEELTDGGNAFQCYLNGQWDVLYALGQFEACEELDMLRKVAKHRAAKR